MQRYFLNKSQFHEEYVMITGDVIKHIRRVMRMNEGDRIICCSEEGTCYICELSDVSDEQIQATILSEEKSVVELPIKVTIAHGLPKGDKLELVIQKGTELGANAFIPFEAERSVVKWDAKKAGKKVERWSKIAQEAAEQSHRQVCPNVWDVVKFPLLLEKFNQFDTVLVAYEEAAKNDEKSHLVSELNKMNEGESLLFLFGPEGGFSDREIDLMKENGAVPCGLGPRILRSETAPLYGLSAISYHFELLR
ncbi:16S rRNA (uracil1498-N3)-methyltransferase [Evansella vedderi]|uniref:Ribosomal RNA small subunit methyltransferase E n=1 Tax=Evansella vedderi TaxID=38282 RepID=A0ABT9ZSY1_9BACI|nr:16S rRNA (uracil(1498)-N(3))-methyltransferase [Evansella vedderi]MDQ0254346.1 16S rRNA (uracil1498-N3)-methyltransferase [Evansella vedderi]